jgi:hypothetical protein
MGQAFKRSLIVAFLAACGSSPSHSDGGGGGGQLNGTLTGAVVGTVSDAGIACQQSSGNGIVAILDIQAATDQAMNLVITTPNGVQSAQLHSGLNFTAPPAVMTYTQANTQMCGEVFLDGSSAAGSFQYIATSTKDCTGASQQDFGSYSLDFTSVTPNNIGGDGGSAFYVYEVHGTFDLVMADISDAGNPTTTAHLTF